MNTAISHGCNLLSPGHDLDILRIPAAYRLVSVLTSLYDNHDSILVDYPGRLVGQVLVPQGKPLNQKKKSIFRIALGRRYAYAANADRRPCLQLLRQSPTAMPLQPHAHLVLCPRFRTHEDYRDGTCQTDDYAARLTWGRCSPVCMYVAIITLRLLLGTTCIKSVRIRRVVWVGVCIVWWEQMRQSATSPLLQPGT